MMPGLNQEKSCNSLTALAPIISQQNDEIKIKKKTKNKR